MYSVGRYHPHLEGLVSALTPLKEEIAKLDAEMSRRGKESDVARRLMTVSSIGRQIATAIATLTLPETFRKAQDFVPWLGFTPRQHSIGTKKRL